MKLAVPTNWQEDIPGDMPLDLVCEFYGRSGSALVPADIARVVRHIRSISDKGVRFNYLMDAVCMDNRELTISGQRSLRRLMGRLTDAGAGAVTVSIPYLAEFIKRNYPSCFLCVAPQAGIKDVRTALYWRDLGADAMTLSFTDINRDFSLLRLLRKAVDCELRLTANSLCLYGCPFFRYHSVLEAHAPVFPSGSGETSLDYCSARCAAARFNDPAEFIRAGWIRPEDAAYYEEAGIDALRLEDGGMISDKIKTVVRAYTEGRYDGSLLDLCSGRHENVSIDNRSLDGFIDFFVNGRCSHECRDCGYCGRTAERTVRIDESVPGETAGRLKQALDDFINASLSRPRERC